MKLSKAQQELLNEIKNDIEFAKQFTNAKDYYLGKHITINKNQTRYNELVEWYSKKFEIAEVKELWTKAYNDAINNITIVRAKTETVNKLEQLGFIEILGKSCSWYETVKLLKVEA